MSSYFLIDRRLLQKSKKPFNENFDEDSCSHYNEINSYIFLCLVSSECLCNGREKCLFFLCLT